MKKKWFPFILILIVIPVFSFSQKAYESFYYQDTIHTIAVKFTLGNGYIGASEITATNIKTKKTSKFLPEKNVINDDKKMKFIHYSSSGKILRDYFILEGIEEYYDSVPDKIYGKYYCKKNVYDLTLKKYR